MVEPCLTVLAGVQEMRERRVAVVDRMAQDGADRSRQHLGRIRSMTQAPLEIGYPDSGVGFGFGLDRWSYSKNRILV